MSRNGPVASGRADHWLSLAGGRTSDEDPGWYFTGRAELTREVADFLRDGTGTLVITGAAGTGKSAIIARAVALSDPGFRADPRYREVVARAPADTVPPEGAVDVAISARNKDAAELYEELLALLGHTPPVVDRRERLSTLRLELLGALDERQEPFTVVLDGLDEARNPFETASTLVATLLWPSKGYRGPAIRTVIGVRSPGPATPGAVNGEASGDGTGPAARPDAADEERTRDLLDLVMRLLKGRPHRVLRTDGPDAADDIAGYTESLLAAEPSPYRDAPAARRRRLAEVVAAHVAPSFLDARLAAQRLRESPRPQDPGDPDWPATLGGGTVALLGADIAAVATPAFPERHILAVLRAAAFAQGAGIPWGEIWPAVVEAVLDERPPDTNALIRHVLTGRLSGYLVRDVEDGHVVHRPAHELLARVLRAQPHRVLPPPGPARSPATRAPEAGTNASPHPDGTGDAAEVHRRIAARLAGLATGASSGTPPHPYLRRHLARHAALGGVLDDRHVPADLLPWETGGAIRGLLGLPLAGDERRRTLAAWARIEPFLGDADPVSRAVSLDFARVATDLTAYGEASADRRDRRGPALAAPLRPIWARWRIEPNVLATTSTRVFAITAFPGPDGRTLLAAGEEERGVRIWDVADGTAHAILSGGIGAWVYAVAAFTSPDGRILLAGGGTEGTVRIWDPVKVRTEAVLTGHTGSVQAVVAFPGLDGRPRLATGGSEGTVRIWDPVAGRTETVLTGHTGWVRAVAAFPGPDGRILLASGGEDHTIRVWDVAEGTSRVLLGHTDTVTALAAIPGPDGRTLLASGSHDRTVQIWDIAEGTSRVLFGHTDTVTALAAIPGPDGRTLLASGSHGPTVRIWDPAQGSTEGTLSGHTHGARAVAAFPGAHGRTLLATAGRDGRVRVWDLAQGSTQAVLSDPADQVHAVAAFPGPGGRTLLATAGDHRVRIWDVADGTEQAVLIGHTDRVYAVAAFPGPDGRTLLASGGTDGTVWIWDVTDGTIKAILAGTSHVGAAVAAFPGPDGRTLLATAGRDDTVRIWDPAEGTTQAVLTGHYDSVLSMAVFPGPDGRTLLATGSADHTVRIWDVANGTTITDLGYHGGWVVALAAFPGPDGQPLLAAGNTSGTVRVWDPVRGGIRALLHGHTSWVHAMAAFTGPDGRTLLATGGHDHTMRIWDPADGTPILRVVTAAAVTAIATTAPPLMSPAGGPPHPDAPRILAIGGSAGLAVFDLM